MAKTKWSLTSFSDTGKVRVDNLHYELTEDDITVSARTLPNRKILT